MPFDEPPKLESKHLAIPLFAACKGENRALKHLLLETLKIALIDGANTLANEHFSNAYEHLFSCKEGEAAPINPFTQPIDTIKISEIIRSSRYNSNALSPEDMLIAREFSAPSTLAQLLSK